MLVLKQPCLLILKQLRDLVGDIQPQDFTRPSRTLRDSTIGQHVRHTLEFFLCFERGFKEGVVNYDKRAHDKTIENDNGAALLAIDSVTAFVNALENDKPLKLQLSYDTGNSVPVTVDTNANRELIYNIEHAIHHMAIIKIGLCEIAPYIELPHDFGVATSTIRHREKVLMNSVQR